MRLRASSRHHHAIKSLVAVATCSAALAVGPGLLAAPASPAGLLPSSTALLAVPSDDGTSITLTATVKVLQSLPGLLVTATGRVDFTNGDGSPIGHAQLGTCLLTPCTAALNAPVSDFVTDPETHIDHVTATYEGDALSAGSHGSTDVAIGPDCSTTPDCSITVDGPNEELFVNTFGGSGNLDGSLGGPALPCSVNNGGQVANVSGNGISDGKYIEIDLSGSFATNYEKVIATTGHDYMCYASVNDFDAYSNNGKQTFTKTATDFNSFGDAPLITSGPYAGEHVGLLADCYLDDSLVADSSARVSPDVFQSSDPPCIQSQYVSDGGDLVTQIDAPPSDPHIGGG